MYKIDVEYMKLNEKFIAMIFCNECDTNATNQIFRHEVPDPNAPQNIVGQNKRFVNAHYSMTQQYDNLEDVKKEVKSVIENVKLMIVKEREKVVEKETYEI